MCGCIETVNKGLEDQGFNTKITVPIMLDSAGLQAKPMLVTEKINKKIRKGPIKLYASNCPGKATARRRKNKMPDYPSTIRFGRIWVGRPHSRVKSGTLTPEEVEMERELRERVAALPVVKFSFDYDDFKDKKESPWWKFWRS